MLFNEVSLQLLASLACRTLANTSATANLSSQNSHLPLPNTSRILNTSPISNLSEVIALPIPLPYGFSVPNTDIYLRLGFGLPRLSLDPMSMAGLIAVIQHSIIEGIERDGAEAFPGLDIVLDRQKFGWTLGDGFHSKIRSIQNSGRFFTWGQLQNVVEGLRLYLIVGERYYATAFNFWDGPGWWRRNPLGRGSIIVDRIGKEGSSGQEI
ncbi:hypothetical protein IMSHALPRED_002850 [Imshaugia aleurites]|uniref:Uncharacterized protein n=1 Tax=Imshaugia aleurites TaxID=172621 RepID=A0A8H3J750_9LECA|nr:hypothetical protein IMSHALPRED_002850 [Imshaugia aleurites]